MATLDQIYEKVQALRDEIATAINTSRLNPKQITIVQGLSEINNSLGTIRAGEFLALSNGEDPQDADGVGTFISALGRLFGSKTYHIGGVHDGDLKWGANADTGELEAGDGAVVLNTNGVSVFSGTTEIGRLGNLNGFLSYATDVYGIAMGNASQYMTYDQTNGLKVYGALVSDREILTADRTYYVRTDGNDSNTGLANTTGGAFLTIQKAVDTVANTLDIRNYNVTIQLGDGTYETTGVITLKNLIGTGSVHITGNEGTPSNVLINLTTVVATTPVIKASDIQTIYTLSGFKIASTKYGILASHGAHIKLYNLNFGACTGQIHMKAEWGGAIEITGDYAISGAAYYHYSSVEAGVIVYDGTAMTVTITGTPAFNYFANASINSILYVPYITWSGSTTGARYSVNFNSVIGTNAAGANYFPGDSAGSAANGGIYN